MNLSEELCPASKPVLQLDGKMITMAMGYYHKKTGHPCNRYHELFYNGLLYILYGVVGSNVTTIANNVQLLFQGILLESKCLWRSISCPGFAYD